MLIVFGCFCPFAHKNKIQGITIAEFRSNSISTERRICFAHGEQDQAAKFLLAIITDAPMVMVPHFCELHE